MKEKTLLKIAITCAIVGVIVLYYFSENINVEEKTIEKITLADVDKDVRIKGTVERITEKEKIAILSIAQPKTITVILFKDKNITDLQQGDNVYITGSVQEFEGKPEIIADEVKKN